MHVNITDAQFIIPVDQISWFLNRIINIYIKQIETKVRILFVGQDIKVLIIIAFNDAENQRYSFSFVQVDF